MRFDISLTGVLTAASLAAGVTAANTKTSVKTKALILATDTSGNSVASSLRGYGIPYENVVVPDSTYTLPVLRGSDGTCNYGVIVLFRQLFDNDQAANGAWQSLLTAVQWQKIYDYQSACGVRIVHLGVVPNRWDFACDLISSTTGTEANAIYSANHQYFLDTNVAGIEFPTAGLKNPKNARMSSTWHTPGSCDDSLLQYAGGMLSQNVFMFTEAISVKTPTSTTNSLTAKPAMGVINRYNNREQMAFFTTFSTWAESSFYMHHVWIHWAYRGIISGERNSFLSLQVDDLLLPTAVYSTNYTYRLSVDDVVNHAKWQKDLNKRLAKANAGSDIFLEFGFNGNGAFIYDQTVLGLSKNGTCPISVTYTGAQIVTSLEYAKPPGTGIDLWPSNTTWNWPEQCIFYDPIAKIFSQKNTGGDNINGVADIFALVSHTFTHEGENPITFADAVREITFNQKFQKLSKFDQAAKFSPKGIIPPAITGLHNADAIKAWMDNGIKYVVGDNTRSPLRNPQNDHWPLVSNTADNGYPGLVIIPRWASRIYYNADGVASDLQEWLDVSPSQATNSFTNLLAIERSTTSQYLLGLYHDPYMFHQANLRVWDKPGVTVNGVDGPWSLIQMWTESIIDEFTQYVTWPIRSLTHDELGDAFVARMERDLYSGSSIAWTTSDDGTSITGFTVSVSNTSWVGEIPVMIPGDVANVQNARAAQYGSDPTTLWVSKFPATFQLKSPIKLAGSKITTPSVSVALITTIPALSLPTEALEGSFPVSGIISAKSTSAASASLSSAASASSASSANEASSAKTTAKTSSSATAKTTAKVTASSTSKAKATSTTASKTTSGPAASSTADGTVSDGQVSQFLNSICSNSATAANFGTLCQLWSAFKSTGKLQRRIVIPGGIPIEKVDFEGKSTASDEKKNQKRDSHQLHRRHNKHS